MEEGPENSKESLNSAHANGMNEWTYRRIWLQNVLNKQLSGNTDFQKRIRRISVVLGFWI